MTRARKTGPRPTATDTLTLRLTPEDRALLDRLVDIRGEELADEGVEVTAASYVRGLIRREAKAKGLLTETSTTDARPGEHPSAGAVSVAKAEPVPKADDIRAALDRAIAAGTSQAEIARRAELNAGHLSRFKAGKGGLSDDALRRLADVLKVR